MIAATATFQSSKKPPACQISRLHPARASLLQRKCACGGTPGPSGECEECRKKQLQRKVAQPSTLNHQHSEVPPIVHEVLRSPGQPLDASAREVLEPRFGFDFSQVRIHADREAAESARALSAHAYTVGRDVVFGSGLYGPHTQAGLRLLAHELTHVAQQSTGTAPAAAPRAGSLEVSDPTDPQEREADQVADRVMRSVAAVMPSQCDHARLPRMNRSRTERWRHSFN